MKHHTLLNFKDFNSYMQDSLTHTTQHNTTQ